MPLQTPFRWKTRSVQSSRVATANTAQSDGSDPGRRSGIPLRDKCLRLSLRVSNVEAPGKEATKQGWSAAAETLYIEYELKNRSLNAPFLICWLQPGGSPAPWNQGDIKNIKYLLSAGCYYRSYTHSRALWVRSWPQKQGQNLTWTWGSLNLWQPFEVISCFLMLMVVFLIWWGFVSLFSIILSKSTSGCADPIPRLSVFLHRALLNQRR